MSQPARRANASASPRPREASDRSRAARSTSTLTTTATRMNTRIARRFSASAIVNVRTGGVKYQFAISDAAIAEATAGQRPPIAATATTSDR